MAEGTYLGRTQSDINLTALAVEAERRRKERGLIRYNYGDLVAEITPEERRQIIEDYQKRLHRKRSANGQKRFVERLDKIDMAAIRENGAFRRKKKYFIRPRKSLRRTSGNERSGSGSAIAGPESCRKELTNIVPI